MKGELKVELNANCLYQDCSMDFLNFEYFNFDFLYALKLRMKFLP